MIKEAILNPSLQTNDTHTNVCQSAVWDGHLMFTDDLLQRWSTAGFLWRLAMTAAMARSKFDNMYIQMEETQNVLSQINRDTQFESQPSLHNVRETPLMCCF